MSKSYECTNCGMITTGEDIDAVTIKNCCLNRKDRRGYVNIDKTTHNDKKWYQCPKCGKNIRRFGFKEVQL